MTSSSPELAEAPPPGDPTLPAEADRKPMTPATAADLLTDMECGAGATDAAAARSIIAAAALLRRPDLTLRAQLILADAALQSGDLRQAGSLADATLAGAARHPYVLARAHYLLARIRTAVGDLPSARTHAERAVGLLPADAPTAVRVDHLLIAGLVSEWGAAAHQFFDDALSLIDGDTKAVIRVHTDLAEAAVRGGDLPTATASVRELLRRSAPADLPLATATTVAKVHLTTGHPAAVIALLGPRFATAAPTPTEADGAAASHCVIEPGGTVPQRMIAAHREAATRPEAALMVARAYRQLGQFAPAAALLRTAADGARRHGLDATATRALEERAHLAAARQDFRAAYRAHQEFTTADATRRAAELRARAQMMQAGHTDGVGAAERTRFRELALRDALTGLYNRRFIDTQLAESVDRAAAIGAPLSAAIIDADRFKSVNDTYSHATGDLVLRQLAAIIAEIVVAPETPGRLGGEEFIVLMPGASSAAAFRRCEQIRAAVAAHDWSRIADGLTLSVSIGVTTAEDGHTSAAALLADADRNLYAAKRCGRNRVMADAR